MTLPRVAVVDYGRGNLGSVVAALARVGARPEIVATPAGLEAAQGLVLPGVGSFRDAAATLAAHALDRALRNACARGRPLLGICLGMQLLFGSSEEGVVDTGAAGAGTALCRPAGLALLPGRVTRLADTPRLPHIGWNEVRPTRGCPQADRLSCGRAEYYYFAHSYAAADVPPDMVKATTNFGQVFPAIVGRNLVFGVQFHPERSGKAGLELLQRYVEVVRRCR